LAGRTKPEHDGEGSSIAHLCTSDTTMILNQTQLCICDDPLSSQHRTQSAAGKDVMSCARQGDPEELRSIQSGTRCYPPGAGGSLARTW
jgi:hypothetical protein